VFLKSQLPADTLQQRTFVPLSTIIISKQHCNIVRWLEVGSYRSTFRPRLVPGFNCQRPRLHHGRWRPPERRLIRGNLEDSEYLDELLDQEDIAGIRQGIYKKPDATIVSQEGASAVFRNRDCDYFCYSGSCRTLSEPRAPVSNFVRC
jgi:hypothetical protein